MRTLVGVMAAAAVLAASGAQAEILPKGGVTVQEVAAALQAKGYQAEIGKDKDGDPKISSGMDGSRFIVWFYDCKNNRCAAVQFGAAFKLKDAMTLAKVNSWNTDRRFLKVFLDAENDPCVEYDVDFEVGATTEAIGNAIEVWAAGLPKFKGYIGFQR